MLSFLTAGESHGKQLTVIIEGVPAGLKINKDKINQSLKERQRGFGRGERMKIEEDEVIITSGIRAGMTLGSPITMIIENKDWGNWVEVMSPEIAEVVLEKVEERKVLSPRPGHADLPGAIKYHHQDIRNVLERASARETAIRVAAGALLSQLLEEFGIELISYVVQVGDIKAKIEKDLSFDQIKDKINLSKLRCLDEKAEEAMIVKIKEAMETGDTLGGIFEVKAFGVPVGLGSYTQWDKRLNARLAFALMSIPAVKGVEIGMGFKGVDKLGSVVHDEIFFDQRLGFYRKTNQAGGIEGGISNGEDIILRAAVKPIPTLRKGLSSVNILSKEEQRSAYERSDVCVLPAASVVGLSMVAIELARAFLEKFGGDHLQEIKKNHRNYQQSCRLAFEQGDKTADT
ncbi:chorismate synthase [bacterium]|nr:chorismate synthase [bacterium]